MSLWDPDNFSENSLLPQVEDGNLWICILGGKVAGLLKFQMEDELYWPSFPRVKRSMFTSLLFPGDLRDRG